MSSFSNLLNARPVRRVVRRAERSENPAETPGVSTLSGEPTEESGRYRLEHWVTALGDDNQWASPEVDDTRWAAVTVPHNWDDYHGYHEVSHGNLHGTAWYRTRFQWDAASPSERLYAFFEGVGSYAKVYCNGVLTGEHAGGRTTFTVDLTAALRSGENLLAVRSDHPEKINDLPFVCGGCWGAPNTEGSQPFGMFRPAWLERTGPVRVEPFGVHILTPEISKTSARVEVRTELSNPGERSQQARLLTELLDPNGRCVWSGECEVAMKPGERRRVIQAVPPLPNPLLWAPGHPHLYRAVTTVLAGGRRSHRAETTYGLRWLEWPAIVPRKAGWNWGDYLSALSNSQQGVARVLVAHPDAPVSIDPACSTVHLRGAKLPESAALQADLEFHASPGVEAELLCEIQNGGGTIFFHQHRAVLRFEGDNTKSYQCAIPDIHNPGMWTSGEPNFHRLVVELRSPKDHTLWERSEIWFGIRACDGPLNLPAPEKSAIEESEPQETEPSCRKVLLLNGEPIFIHGTAEYEHLLGCDHAFTDEQIAASAAMVHSTGFNAIRDAHHPHNLRYYDHWDRLGLLCWTQMGSHIWFDNSGFRENFKTLVREWVRERRNHPSVILWGLQNESSIPESFTLELRDIVRELDPTSPTWRLTTTCNGGDGSDWNVPQEWTGTYGGNCHDYDLERWQLVGEYGAWRDFAAHTETVYCGDENDRSETWACYAMETKVRLAETFRDRAVGHFHWSFNTFQNPGRVPDNFEGAGNAQVGSVNNKGLVTVWQQPSDLFYMYRANFADPVRDPMVYIVSHTWPDRWEQPGQRPVRVYSNCEEVELFNGVGVRSLGTLRQPGRGLHFEWEGVKPETNVLYAVARNGGREVARDLIVLDHLPADTSLAEWLGPHPAAPADPGHPLFRVSCGADQSVTDSAGRLWEADTPWRDGAAWGWTSWGMRFDNVADDLASRGYTMTPVRGTYFPELYTTYRYGRHDLKYRFRVQPGIYRVRLHTTEPWFGVGGNRDCRGWRLFDIAVNDTVFESRLDVWTEAGGDHRALAREIEVPVETDELVVHFPAVQSAQAIICGIEIFGPLGL